jgi:uroporphyrinogen-III synthase
MQEPDAVRVIVTRPQSEAGKWLQTLVKTGYDAVALPLICIEPASDSRAIVAAWKRLSGYDAVMFVSANAVTHFFALKPTQEPVFTAQTAIKSRAFVTGPASQAALMHFQAQAQCIDAPDREVGQFDSESLWAVVRHRVQPDYRVLIVRGSGRAGAEDATGAGRDWFANQVMAAGGNVDFVVAYRRRAPELDQAGLAMARQCAVNGAVWLFSSSEAIANLVAAVPEQSWGQAKAIVTHPRIGQVAREAGFAAVYESRPLLADLMASIESMP